MGEPLKTFETPECVHYSAGTEFWSRGTVVVAYFLANFYQDDQYIIFVENHGNKIRVITFL